MRNSISLFSLLGATALTTLTFTAPARAAIGTCNADLVSCSATGGSNEDVCCVSNWCGGGDCYAPCVFDFEEYYGYSAQEAGTICQADCNIQESNCETQSNIYKSFAPQSGATTTDFSVSANGGHTSGWQTKVATFTSVSGGQAVNYIGSDSTVHQTYYEPSGWQDASLNVLAHSTATLSGGSSLAAFGGSDGSEHVFYVDSVLDVHELSIVPGQNWTDTNVTTWPGSNGVPVTYGSALDAYQGTNGSKHVNFVDNNGNVNELYWNGSNWQDNSLFAMGASGPTAVPDTLDGYLLSDGTQHVDYIDWSGDVHELYFNLSRWINTDLSTQMTPRANPAYIYGGLAGYQLLKDSTQHIDYVDNNGDVNELAYNLSAWVHTDLTGASNGVPAVPYSQVWGFWDSAGNQYVVSVDAQSDLHVLYYGYTFGQWTDINLTYMDNSSSAAPVFAGTGVSGYWLNGSGKHIDYIDTNYNMNEFHIP
jgi:hypothetical protein